MAKKKISTTQLIIGAAVIGTIGYLVLRKPTPAVTAGNGNGNGTGEGSSGDLEAGWTYRVVQQGNVWIATFFDPVGNSEQLPPQGSDAAASAMAKAAILEYGGIPVRV